MKTRHPYLELNDYNFWYRSMTAPAPGHIDPVVRSEIIYAADKVSTMGSCFAQHLSKDIVKAGLNYFVSEQAPVDLAPLSVTNKNYGVFSARYGNIYTARQALQLFDRAFGLFNSDEHIWIKDGRYLDAFRPQIEPHGFDSTDSLLKERESHLACVRRIFEESDWLIFTLGLTEAWRSRRDGSIFPIAPGVVGGQFNKDEHEFINFTAAEVALDLQNLITKIGTVNPKIKILLTVSPVPLIATYEKRHVLVSTCLSKSALRVAADVIERQFSNVIYFPSYEIITSPANAGRYYRDDLRQVTDIGVNHVMRIFTKHFIDGKQQNTISDDKSNFSESKSSPNDVICDEEAIEKAIKQSGF